MKQFLFTLLCSILLGPCQLALAEEVRYYDIELVIFESADPAARQSEVLKKNLASEPPPVFVELDQPYPGPIPPEFDPNLTFKSLPESTFLLTEEVKLMQESKNYNILQHIAWRQPGMDVKQALPVHLHREFVYRVPSALSASNLDMPASNLPQPNIGEQSRSILDGYVRIILSRYLHAEVDLSYTITNTPPVQFTEGQENLPAEQVEPLHYRLNQSRKMRSKEVHYLDHPLLGVIITVNPYAEVTPATDKK